MQSVCLLCLLAPGGIWSMIKMLYQKGPNLILFLISFFLLFIQLLELSDKVMKRNHIFEIHYSKNSFLQIVVLLSGFYYSFLFFRRFCHIRRNEIVVRFHKSWWSRRTMNFVFFLTNFFHSFSLNFFSLENLLWLNRIFFELFNWFFLIHNFIFC